MPENKDKMWTRSSMQSIMSPPKTSYITRSVLKESIKLPLKMPKSVAFEKSSLKSSNSQSDLSVSEEGVTIIGSRNSNLFDIPAVLVRPQHRLKQTWTLWYYCNDKLLDWEENQQAVATVTTIEEFWQLNQLLVPTNMLPVGCDYAMFRSGIKPNWEDKANAKGGRWVIRKENDYVNDAWLEVLFFVLGEHCPDLVNGVVINKRKRINKVSVWIRDATNMIAIVDVGRQIKCRMGLENDMKIQFMTHKESKELSKNKQKRLWNIML